MAITMVKGYAMPPQEAGSDYSGFAGYGEPRRFRNAPARQVPVRRTPAYLTQTIPALNGFGYYGNPAAVATAADMVPDFPDATQAMVVANPDVPGSVAFSPAATPEQVREAQAKAAPSPLPVFLGIGLVLWLLK